MYMSFKIVRIMHIYHHFCTLAVSLNNNRLTNSWLFSFFSKIQMKKKKGFLQDKEEIIVPVILQDYQNIQLSHPFLGIQK